MAKKLLSIVCVLQMWAMVIGEYRLDATQNPALDDEIEFMLPCFSYLYQGSEYTTPNGQCCSGFKELLDKKGICDFINQAEPYGLDVKRILGLPDACHVTYALNCPGAPTPTPPTPIPSPHPPRKPSPTPSPEGPSPPGGCTGAMSDIAPCFPYLQKGSSASKPDADCCNGFKQVLKENPGCVCVGVKAAPGFGLDVERILGLPSACGVSYTIDCSTPSPSPPETPVPSPSPPKAPSPPETPVPSPSPPKTPTPSPPETPVPSPSPPKTPTPSPQPPPKTPGPPAPPETSPPPPESSPNTPPPPPDCYSVLFWNMHDCSTYVTIGSNDSTPNEGCCNGFKDVLTIEADCLCAAVRHAAENNFDVNRILGLPAACGSSYVLGCCEENCPPPPQSSAMPPAPAPVPAPAPPKSGSAALSSSISFLGIGVSLAALSFCYY